MIALIKPSTLTPTTDLKLLSFMFKKKVTVEQMSEVLYVHTINKSSIEDLDRLLDKKNINKEVIQNELIFLKIFIVDSFLHKEKIQKKYGEKVNSLFIYYLKHFTNEAEKNEVDDSLINLLEDRINTYNNFIEQDNHSTVKSFPFKIAEQLQRYCNLEYDGIFISWTGIIMGDDIKWLTKIFDKFKLVN